MLQRAEEFLVERLGWPLWALRMIAGLSALVLCTAIAKQFGSRAGGSASGAKKPPPAAFRMFQLHYLAAYLITMLADWLQGTNMYTLYASYNVNIGALFLTGFLSSAVFGTFLGIYVDSWGRKTGVVIFCVLEIVINLLEHVPSMPILLLGRVLGGLSTSLLFTAFESWMVSEHRRQGFDETLLESTFSIASAGNGIAAIAAGIFAQTAADVSGDIGPFQLAIALTVVTLVIVLPWRENYGSEHDYQAAATSKLWHSLKTALHAIRTNPDITRLGLSQACFEGAVYSFVFLWVPSLMKSYGGAIPTGLVFSAFMLSMTFGGMICPMLLAILPGGAEALCALIYLAAAGCMAVLQRSFSFPTMLTSFLVLEALVGMHNSCGATLRSKYYPEHLQASLMSVFRLPLNLLVVAGTQLASNAGSTSEMQFVFGVITVMHWIAFILQVSLCSMRAETTVDETKLPQPQSPPEAQPDAFPTADKLAVKKDQ